MWGIVLILFIDVEIYSLFWHHHFKGRGYYCINGEIEPSTNKEASKNDALILSVFRTVDVISSFKCLLSLFLYILDYNVELSLKFFLL